MKGMKYLMTVFIVLAMATVLSAATVTLKGDVSGKYTLKNMNIDSNGDILIDLSAITGGCENTAPELTVTNKPTSAIVGQEIYADVAYSDVDGNPVSVTANPGVISGNQWSWTPSQAGRQTVTITADDSQSCNNTTPASWTVNVTTTDGGGGGNSGTELPSYPPTITQVTIPAKAEEPTKFYLVIPKDATFLSVNMATGDWDSDADIMVSKIAYPTWQDYYRYAGTDYSMSPDSDFWFVWSHNSNESVKIGGLNLKQGDLIYVAVFNNTDWDADVQLYWSSR